MSTDFVQQPQNDDRFLEEAIDLLLFLEQELPNYTKDSNPVTALALMEAAYSLHSIATTADLDAIAIVAAALGEIFELLHQYQPTVNDTIDSLLSEGLDCLQTLLMSFLTSSKIEEVEILERMSAIVTRLQTEFGDSQQSSILLELNLETLTEQTPQEHQAVPVTITPVIQFSDRLAKVEPGGMETLNQKGDFHAWLGDYSQTSEISQASVSKSFADNQTFCIQQSIPAVVAKSTPPATHINPKHLEQLNALIATLLTTYNQQACQEEQQQHTIRQLLRQVKRLQHLLDNLQEWSGRLAAISNTLSPLAASRSQQLYSTVQSVLAEASQVTSTVHSLNQNHRQLNQELLQQEKLINHSSNLVKTVTNISLKIALEPLHRLWSQLQALQDKSATLRLQISDIEIDRALSDRLHTLLLHLSCYLLDQSIESSQTRQQFGKNNIGSIEIQIYQQGNQLIIDGCDDGIGLNLSKIHLQALAQGLALAKQDDTLQTTQLSELLLEPEVSSVLCDRAAMELGAELTEVCKQLTAIQGKITLKSKPGHGTAFSVQIPLGQKIAQLIVCQAKSKIYAFIADSVEQICLSQSEQILQTQAGRMLFLQPSVKSNDSPRGDNQYPAAEMLVPIHLLTDVLICPNHISTSVINYSTDKVNALKQDKPLLLFRYLDKRCAIEVDRIISKQSSVIHPLEETIPVATYIKGTTILANGQISLVLDGHFLTQSLILTSNSCL